MYIWQCSYELEFCVIYYYLYYVYKKKKKTPKENPTTYTQLSYILKYLYLLNQ